MRLTFSRLLVLASLLAFAACRSVERPDLPTPECNHDSDCPTGEVCGPGGSCGPQCAEDRDCSTPRLCSSGACTLPTGRCEVDGDCGATQACGFNWTCATRCASSSQCATGEECLGGICLSRADGECARASDCTAGKICSAAGACVDECVTSSDCDAPRVCSSGSCLVPAGRCEDDSHCASGDACGFKGTCTQSCTSTTQCAAGFVCLAQLCLEQGPSECSRNSDCSTGQACVDNRCAAGCIDDNDCSVGATCSSGYCTPQVPQCVDASNCQASEACSPQGNCVVACSVSGQCQTGEVCSAGACVVSNAGTATVSGSVRFAGLTDHSGVTVSLRGPNTVSILTTASGDYTLSGLSAGLYLVVATASSSAEERVERELAASPGVTTTAPTISFTPVGEIRGTAQLAGRTTHTGIQVFVTGTSTGASTDAAGAFSIKKVPVGSHEIVASYTGFTPAGVAGLAVTRGGSTVAPSLTLQTPPNTAGSFAFSSTPPQVAYQGRPYLYAAVAGGAGVTSVSYSVAAGPVGFSINSSTGLVTFTADPNLVPSGNHTVAIAANGGGPIVYQVYTLEIRGQYDSVYAGDFFELDEQAGVIWGAHNGGLLRIAGASVDNVPSDTGTITGQVGTVSLANGGALTSLQVPGGTLASVSGSFGPVSAAWPGGTLGAVTPLDLLTVSQVSPVGGTLTSQVRALDSDVISALTYVRGTVEATSDGRATPTAIRTDTGVATGVAATVLTDTAASWTADLSTRCLASPEGGRIDIASNTPTEITITGADLTIDFWAGRRYFIVDCAAGNATFVLEDLAATFPSLSGRRLDLYLPGQSLGNFVVLAGNTATTLSFVAAVNQYSNLAALASAGGFYIVAQANNLLAVTMTDSTQNFPASLTTANQLAIDDSTNFTIVSNTATTITYSVALGAANFHIPGARWRLTEKNNPWNTLVTVTLPASNFTASQVGRYLFFDANSKRYFITAHTTTTATVRVPNSDFSLSAWVGSEVAVVTGTTGRPTLQVTDSVGGLVPNRWAGLSLQRRTPGGASPYSLEGAIISNTATEIVFQPANCGTCPLAIASARLRLAGASYVVGLDDEGAYLRVDLTGGAQSPDALVGRVVALLQDPSRLANVVGNGPDWVDLEVDDSVFDTFAFLSAGSQLWLSRMGAPVAQPTWRLRVADSAGGLVPGAWVEHFVITESGQVSGRVLSNDASVFELSTTVANALAYTRSGGTYAMAQPTVVGGCSGVPVTGWIPATVSLAGATLLANTYDTLRTQSGKIFPVRSNDTGGALAEVCPVAFGDLLFARGTQGTLTRGTSLTITVEDPLASYAPGGLVGQKLAIIRISAGSSNVGARTPVLASNTATQLSFSVVNSDWLNILDEVAPGSRYVVVQADEQVRFTAQTSLNLALGSLEGRLVSLLNLGTTTRIPAMVDSHTASELTLLVDDNDSDELFLTDAKALDAVSTSNGYVFKVTDPSKSFTPGALVGRTAELGWVRMEVVRNTATEVWMATASASANTTAASGAPYRIILGMDYAGYVAAMPDGSAITTASNQLVQVDLAGVRRAFTSLGTSSTTLTLSPRPAVRRIVQSSVTVNGFNTIVVQGPPMVPGAHAGGFVRRWTFDSWDDGPVVDNTATTLIVAESFYSPVGSVLFLEDYHFTVQGGGLTPGALAGKTLRMNGLNFLIRSNTATEIALAPANSIFDDELPPAASPDGTIAQVLDGLSSFQITGLEDDGADGFYVGQSDRLTHFNGTTWTSYGWKETSTVFGTGTVTGLNTSSVIDSGASYPVDSLVGKRLLLSSGMQLIVANTTTEISVTPGFRYGSGSLRRSLWPLIGDGYAILDADGFGGNVQTLSRAGSSLFVGTSGEGVFKKVGSTWTHYTAENTESSPGAGDGLDSNYVYGLAATGPDSFWSTPENSSVTHFDGSTWTTLTKENTESAPGAGDGLHNDYVRRIHAENGEVWFCSYDGVTRLRGGVFTQFTASLDFEEVWDVEITSTGDVLIASENDVGLVKLVP